MLTRLYIDNFRCFEKFEYRPARKQLILGANGSGKSSLMDALSSVRRAAVTGDRIDEVFSLFNRTRWLNEPTQVFEMEASLLGRNYVYHLAIEPWGEPLRMRVQSETVRCDGQPIFEFDRGEVQLYNDRSELLVNYPADQSRSALAAAGGNTVDTQLLLKLRLWMDRILCFRLNPFAMEARTEKDKARGPRVDLANTAEWYQDLHQARPKESAEFNAALREAIDGFDQLTLPRIAENVRGLSADFIKEGRSVQFAFGELSDGQRCLICLYAILHFVIAKGGTVIIDEPENFISLREIQPWLMSAADMADDHKGQVLLISHHPELIDQWAPSYGIYFVRDGAGPVHTEPLRKDTESGLSVSELIARGWERE